MPITQILERNCKLYGDEVCLIEVNPESKLEEELLGRNTNLLNQTHRIIIDVKSHGMYLMKKQIVLLTF